MEVLQHLAVDRHGPSPIETQIARQLERLIAAAALTGGDRLPPIRRLADRLGVNLHTVRAAYLRLEAQGLVEVTRGRGTTVVDSPLARFAAARSAHRSFTIGVVLPALASFYAPVLAGIHEAQEGDPSQILVGFADERLDLAEAHLRHFAREADGIIVVSQTVSDPGELSGPGFPPIVFADWPGSPAPSVTFSPSPIGDLVHHLAEHGRDRLTLITPPQHHPNVGSLVDAYRSAAAEYGLGLETADLVEVPDWTIEDGRRAMTQILDSANPPAAVMAATDPLAIGAMRAARARGMVIGRDLAVTGYGDSDLATIVSPALTTVRLPARRLGQAAMEKLLDMIDGSRVAAHTELTGTTVRRASCGCEETPA